MPYTVIPEEPSTPASQGRFTVVPEPSPQGPPTDPRESFAAGMAYPLEQPLAMGSGAINYALQGGAPGSYESGYQDFRGRLNRKWNDNPKTAAAGMGTSIGLGLATGGGSIPALARGSVRPLAAVLSKGGKIAETLAEPAAVVHGSKHLELAMKYGGRAARAGAERLRGNPEGARELLIDALKEKFPRAWQREHAAAERAFNLAPENQPPPGSGALSAEMRAALKRGKFRHDYSTGEWGDLLEPGGVSRYRGDY